METSSEIPEIVPPEIPVGGDNLNVETLTTNVTEDDELDSELMSDFSKLQIGTADCPQTFSPIGSERTSPEQGLLCVGLP